MPDIVSAIIWIFNTLTLTSLVVSVLTIFLPIRSGHARRILATLRPLLIFGILCICACAYHVFWFSMLPYWDLAPLSLLWNTHVTIATTLVLHTVWNYVFCVIIDPAAVELTNGAGAAPARHCSHCDRHIVNLDHHCPMTGGCIGEHNFRYFALFLLYSWLGSGYACAISWRPYRECVLDYSPDALYSPEVPEFPQACVILGARATLLLSAAACFVCLGSLSLLHALLAANGLTTLHLHKDWRKRGCSVLADLVLFRAEPRCDKWAMVWGEPNATILRVLGVLVIPSRPRRSALPFMTMVAPFGAARTEACDVASGSGRTKRLCE